MSNANSQDSSKPKPPTEGIDEITPRQLALFLEILLVKSLASANTSSSASIHRKDSFPLVHASMIRKGGMTKREMKKLTREISLAETSVAGTPEYLSWSKQAVTFGLNDHPSIVPRPGHAALVVEAQIGGFNMNKVFMDRGSDLNLLFINTLHAMGISPNALSPTEKTFHGVILTNPGHPSGKISLKVVFGQSNN